MVKNNLIDGGLNVGRKNLTNAEIWGANFVLGIIAQQKFPVMISYKLAKLLHKIRDAVKPIEDTRNALIVKHGAVNEKLVKRK